MSPLRFLATVRPKWRVVVEMTPAEGGYAVRVGDQKMRDTYRDEADVLDLMERRYGTLERWEAAS